MTVVVQEGVAAPEGDGSTGTLQDRDLAGYEGSVGGCDTGVDDTQDLALAPVGRGHDGVRDADLREPGREGLGDSKTTE